MIKSIKLNILKMNEIYKEKLQTLIKELNKAKDVNKFRNINYKITMEQEFINSLLNIISKT